MSEQDRIRSTKYLRKDHANFEIVGKPALCVNHMQRGLAGEGLFIPNWGPNAKKGIIDSGMTEKCRELADAFRAKGLPVIFVNAIPKPMPYSTAYGDLSREQDAAFPQYKPFYTDEFTRKGLEVMPEMGLTDKDYVLYNWNIHPFTNSGLDELCRVLSVDTLVWVGFAQNSVVYTSCLVAADHWLNSIVPVDASYICVPPMTPDYYEGIDDVVAEAVVRVMMPTVARVTDTAAVLNKINNFTGKTEEQDHRFFK